jgi:DNA-binding XRE family transcriptional regulator
MARPEKRRRQIASEAARRLARGGDLRRARIAAARRLTRDWVPEEELPSVNEVSRELARQRLTDEPDSSGGMAGLFGDRYDRLAALVQPLAAVRLDASQYQAATQLDASLQAFAAVEQQRPYDEELLTAVLLADAGRAYDRRDPIKAILAAAAGLLTERTVWLITMRDEAHAYAVGTLGKRARQRLVTHPDFDDVSLLASAVDRHRSGCEISDLPAYTLDKAISLLRDLGAESGDSDCL